MSTYVFSLNDISVEDGSPVVSVNNSDSFFGLIEGSQLFIAGKLPATIIDHDTTANTLTLKYNWHQGDLSNVAAQVVPIGAVGVLLQALENNRAAYASFLSTMEDWSGNVDWEQLIDPPPTSTRWPDFTEITGDITGLQAIIDLVSDYESKDDSVREDLNARIDGIESTFATVYTASTSINALDHLDKMIITTSDVAVRVNLLDAPLDSEFSLVQEGQGIVTFHSPKTILNRQGFYKTAGQFANAYARVIEHDGDLHWAVFGDLAN
ncbi:hypothetical protein [Alteromonas sp.]|uniref:hypothetical protein n=1 Tax=Alteromonas sp. TaxID=232 RepID=UPI00257C5918|nr:hypothetical protein [Alteromonas sp.]NQY17775.1 hypothetical protein [Alteromonas sp.]